MPDLVWLVTGCSSGFGEEFVKQILTRGDKVIATARNHSKIQKLQDLGATTLQLDVTDAQPKIDAVIAEAIGKYGRVDVLVNNAGFVTAGSWEDLRYDDFLASYETNVLGPIKVTRAVLPHMRQRKIGTLVFISSLSGWIGHGFTGAYASSKFALEGAVESLRNEISPLGLQTLLLEPGRFRTLLLSEANLRMTRSEQPDYEKASDEHSGHLEQGNMKQPGDARKFVRLAIDLVRHEGLAESKQVPFRLPVGQDSVAEIESKLAETQKVINEWKSVITNTDHEE